MTFYDYLREKPFEGAAAAFRRGRRSAYILNPFPGNCFAVKANSWRSAQLAQRVYSAAACLGRVLSAARQSAAGLLQAAAPVGCSAPATDWNEPLKKRRAPNVPLSRPALPRSPPPGLPCRALRRGNNSPEAIKMARPFRSLTTRVLHDFILSTPSKRKRKGNAWKIVRGKGIVYSKTIHSTEVYPEKFGVVASG